MNLATIIKPHPAGSVALRHEGGDVTYGELRARAAAVRGLLASCGIGAADTVAIIYPTAPDFAVAYFGILGLGAVACPLNPESPIAEIQTELSAIEAKAVMIGGARAEALRPEIDALGYLVLACPDSDAADEAHEAGGVGGAGDEPEAPPPIAERGEDDVAVLLFTSGTAGSPKAAMLTHGNLRSNIDQMELAVGLGATSEDVGLLVVPAFHIYGLNAVLGIHLFAGGRLVMMERFSAAEVLALVEAEGVTILPGVPQLFAALVDHPGATGEELRSVRLACSGAAPLSPEVAQAFEARFGLRIWQAYGLTEASPTVTFPDLARPPSAMSVGVPLPGVEVALADTDGIPVEPGDPGEILVRGPNVFSGYFGNPSATAAALDRAGWLHTGDVAVMDAEGAITLVDRNKDLIIVSGFNVFPAEVEHVLEEHDAVAEAVVVGVPDAELGESVRAYVVPTPEVWPEHEPVPTDITEAALIEHCARRLARYKCPNAVVFVREVPHGIQGKVLRRALG